MGMPSVPNVWPCPDAGAVCLIEVGRGSLTPPECLTAGLPSYRRASSADSAVAHRNLRPSVGPAAGSETRAEPGAEPIVISGSDFRPIPRPETVFVSPA